MHMTLKRYAIVLLVGGAIGSLFVHGVSSAQSDNEVAHEDKTYWDNSHTKLKTLEQYDAQDRQHGATRIWDENGTLVAEAIFKHGELTLYRSWYGTGIPRTDEHCREGLMDGWQTWYAPDGSVLKRIFFTMGTGVEYYFDDTGKEKKHVFWISGVKLRDEQASPPQTQP